MCVYVCVINVLSVLSVLSVCVFSVCA
jgi:hypothetical protein